MPALALADWRRLARKMTTVESTLAAAPETKARRSAALNLPPDIAACASCS